MAHAWVLIEFTDATGKHEVGEKLDLPRNTDAEKAEFGRMLDYGMITEREPAHTKDPGSTSSRRRSSG